MIDKQNMAVPAFHKFIYPILKEIVHKEKLSLSEGVDLVKKEFQLTQQDLEERVSSGVTRVYDRVSWSFTYLKKAGLINNIKRGTYVPTDQAESFLRDPEIQQKETITLKDLKRFESFVEFTNPRSSQSFQQGNLFERGEDKIEEQLNLQQDGETPNERFEREFGILEREALDDILDQVRAIHPTSFERLCLKLLKKMGYGEAKHTGGPGDGGIDGKMLTDGLGLDVIYLQMKRYEEGHPISPEKINSFIGALDNNKSHKGIFITSSHFSKSCCNIAERSSKQIRLIDGNELAKLIYDNDLGLADKKEYTKKEFDLEKEMKKAS